jgi:hypothetical protein
MRGDFWVARRARNARMAQMRLSTKLGVVHPRGDNRLVPADIIRLRPAPTWIPLITGVGIARVNHCRRPVALKINTTPEVVNPAEIVSSIENFLEIATAAMAC